MIPKIYAHRGASGDAPENTMAAFRLALDQGADGIELDVQRTSDGKLIVIHDETLQRTTNGKGAVVDHTYGQIRKLDASHSFKAYRGESIPLLNDVLQWIRPTRLELNIELKNSVEPYAGMDEEVIRQVKTFGLEERTVLSTFNHYSVRRLAALAPNIACAVLYSDTLFRPWMYAFELGARALHPHFGAVDRELVTEAHQIGIQVRPWTVNRIPAMKAMLDAGVDAIITNYPLRMRKVMEHSGIGDPI